MSVECPQTIESNRPQREQVNFAVRNPMDFLRSFHSKAESMFRENPNGSELPPEEKKIWIKSMGVEYSHGTGILFHCLKKGAELGYDARLYLDEYSNWTYDGELIPILNFYNYLRILGIQNPDAEEMKLEMELRKPIADEEIKRIEDSGVKVLTLNTFPKILFPINIARHRNHQKLAVAGNAAWLGGMNFYEHSFSDIDLMVEFTDPRIVEKIANEIPRVGNERRTKDARIDCNGGVSVLIDCGNPGKSIGYTTGLEVVRNTQKTLLFTSEVEPEGEFQQALNDAYKRGVNIIDIRNNPEKVELIMVAKGVLGKLSGKQVKPIYPITYAIADLLSHQKILISDNKRALVGSHNFYKTFVKYGTAEALVDTTNETLVKNLTEHFCNVLRNQTI